MMRFTPVKIISSLWIVGFGVASTFTYFHASEIESHQLTQALTFGHDAFGRNCLLLTLETAFRSIQMLAPIAVLCLLFSVLIALIGTIQHTWLQFFYKTLIDTLASLPGFLIALTLGIFLNGERSLMMIAALLMILPYLIRFFESQLLYLEAQEYIASARALGGNSFHIFRKHLLPELLRSIGAISPTLVTRLLVIDTALAFLGVKLSSTHETWGHLLYQGKDYIVEAPWILLTASFPLVLTLFSFHLLSTNTQIE